MAMLYSDPAIQVNEQRVFVIQDNGVKSYNIDEIRAVRLVNNFMGPDRWRRYLKASRPFLRWLGALILATTLWWLVMQAALAPGAWPGWVYVAGLICVFQFVLLIAGGKVMDNQINSIVWTLQFDTPSGTVDVLSQRGSALALSKAKKAVGQAIKRQRGTAGVAAR